MLLILATWLTFAPVTTPRQEVAVAAANDKLYLIGGIASTTVLSSVEEFSNGRWRLVAPLPEPLPLPTARSGIAAAALHGRIYVFGGEGNSQTSTGVFEQNESYDPATNTWRTEEPMPAPRHGIGAAVIDGRIHIPAGAEVQGFGVSARHDAFTIEPGKRRRAVGRHGATFD